MLSYLPVGGFSSLPLAAAKIVEHNNWTTKYLRAKSFVIFAKYHIITKIFSVMLWYYFKIMKLVS